MSRRRRNARRGNKLHRVAESRSFLLCQTPVCDQTICSTNDSECSSVTAESTDSGSTFVESFIEQCMLESTGVENFDMSDDLLDDLTVNGLQFASVSSCGEETLASLISRKRKRRGKGSQQRRTKQKQKAINDATVECLFASISVPKRQRVKNYKLLDYFPKCIINMSNTGIHNLTLPEFGLCDKARILSPIEKVVLSLGPQFIMSPKYLTIDEIHKLYTNFARSVRLKHHFKCNPVYNSRYTALDKLIRIPSAFVPNKANVHVESYLQHVYNGLLSKCMNQSNTSTKYKAARHKYFKSRRTALCIIRTIRRLRKDSSIIVKKSDKNLGLCIVPSVWYEQQAMLHLTDKETYRNLTVLPKMATVFDSLRECINNHNISKKLYDFLFYKEISCSEPHAVDVSLAYFYMLPKIHKSPISTRPIVASIKSVTYNASKYIDFVLKPVMKSFSQVLHSPIDLIRHLHVTTFPPNCVMVTADVTSLYPSIDLEDGLSKLKTAIDLYNEKTGAGLDCNLLVKLCKWVLYNNYICFGSTMWVQIRGTAMGTPLAVVFANIYLAMLERTMFSLYYCKYPLAPANSILLYVRFIDDICSVLCSNDHASTLLLLLNNMHANIRLTHVVSEESVEFLDLTVYKGDLFSTTSVFDLKTYQKPMNAYLYIPLFSYHNRAVFKSFIQSEIRRYTRNSTSVDCVNSMRTLLSERLIARGYPESYLCDILNIQYNRISVVFSQRVLSLYSIHDGLFCSRPACLYPFTVPQCAQASTSTSSDVVIFKIPHSPSFTASVLKDILLYANPSHSLFHDPVQCISSSRHTHPVVCYQRAQSVGDLLINAKYDYDFPF